MNEAYVEIESTVEAEALADVWNKSRGTGWAVCNVERLVPHIRAHLSNGLLERLPGTDLYQLTPRGYCGLLTASLFDARLVFDTRRGPAGWQLQLISDWARQLWPDWYLLQRQRQAAGLQCALEQDAQPTPDALKNLELFSTGMDTGWFRRYWLRVAAENGILIKHPERDIFNRSLWLPGTVT
jgi:hypothetical protein